MHPESRAARFCYNDALIGSSGRVYMRLLLALPAYNEERSLPKLLYAVEHAATRFEHTDFLKVIVIVDDGSRDRTRHVVEDWSSRLPIDLVLHRKNLGLGETILHALQRAVKLSDPDDVIVTMDADNTHPPELIARMIERLNCGFDVVIASRYRHGSAVLGLSAFRRVMSFGARLMFQILCPIPGVRDYTSGYRAYRASLLKAAVERYGEMLITEKSFACTAEILLKLATSAARISEVPLILRYDRKEGASKMSVGQTVWRTVKVFLHARSRGYRVTKP